MLCTLTWCKKQNYTQIIPSLNPKCFYFEYIFKFFSFSWKQSSLNITGQKREPNYLWFFHGWEVQGRSLHDKRQGHLSSWSEQSRPKCRGWRSGVMVCLSYAFFSSSYTLEYVSIDLGTHFAKGIVKIGPPQLIPNLICFRRFPERGRSPAHSSMWSTKVSFNSEGSLRPIYHSLSEVSSR